MNVVHLTLKSGNAKTGPIPVSISTKAFCPDTCPLKSAGCYAEGGPLRIHWDKVNSGERGMSWEAFCEAVKGFEDGTLWRHNQAGDLPHKDGEIDVLALEALVDANEGKRGFAYTHHKPTTSNVWELWIANERGFTVNLSADNLEQADQYAETGLPVVTLLPTDQVTNTVTPAGRRVVVCPATQRDDVTCATCQLCQRRDRTVVIGFPAHGVQKAKANKVFMLKQA